MFGFRSASVRGLFRDCWGLFRVCSVVFGLEVVCGTALGGVVAFLKGYEILKLEHAPGGQH